MAKTDNIGDFCADLAEGLRLKTGKTEPINAQDFRSVLDDIRTFKPEEELFVTPSTLRQEITPSEGNVFNKVTVSPVTNDIDRNITPNNIRTGTVILGVVGNLEPDKPDQTKTITPTTTQQTIYPDSGYELAGVVVNAVNPSDYYKTEESVVIEPSTKVQIKTPNDGVVYNNVVVNAVTNTIDSNIKPENIISGVSILGVNGNLQVHQVKINSENIETTGKTFAVNNQDYVADFTTNGNYLVPETIEVTINGIVLTPNVDYTYTPNHDGYTVTVKVDRYFYAGQKQYYSTDEGLTWVEMPVTFSDASYDSPERHEIFTLKNIKQIMFKTEPDSSTTSLRLMSSETLGFSWVYKTTNYVLTCDVPDVYIWSD